jgi:hypothetical protein
MSSAKLSLDIDRATGKKRINQYAIESELGRGVHGKVKLAIDADGNKVAIKVSNVFSITLPRSLQRKQRNGSTLKIPWRKYVERSQFFGNVDMRISFA